MIYQHFEHDFLQVKNLKVLARQLTLKQRTLLTLTIRSRVVGRVYSPVAPSINSFAIYDQDLSDPDQLRENKFEPVSVNP